MAIHFAPTGMPIFVDTEHTDAKELGPCCSCGKTDGDRFIAGAAYLAPPGSDAWGCAICGIPMAGALVILCPDCAKAGLEPRWVIKGRVMDCQRQPVALLQILQVWDHDKHKHILFAVEYMAMVSEASPTNGKPANRTEEKRWKTN